MFFCFFFGYLRRHGWTRWQRYQDRDGQNWDTRSLFFCNGFSVLPRTPLGTEEERDLDL